jgi:hypothetical protein
VPEASCGVCGLDLFTDLDREREICISCWKKGFHVPLLNRKVFVIPQCRAGVIKMVDTDGRNALVKLAKRKEAPGEKWRRAEPFWERRDWVDLNDLRLWTRERAKRCKSDGDLWRKEPIL